MSSDDRPAMMTREEVADLCRVQAGAIDRMWRRGALPKPVKISGKCIRFWRHEIVAWLESKRVQCS